MTTGPSFDMGVARKIRSDRSLVRELEQLAGGAGMMMVHAQRAWASITFQGARHTFTWSFEGAEDVAKGRDMLEALPEHEFTVPGQLVADAAVVHSTHRVHPERLVAQFELLLLEDA